MSTVWWTICISIIIGILYCNASAEDPVSPRAVRIVNPINHSFHLELDDFRSILQNDNIKDRHVTVVSIAGAFRQGKSFLLNFFVKYLNAQYKSHDVSDWLGENESNSKINGFKFRAGQKPETIGIWMWSEVFTHDFPNGEKIAIILIDTQGIFDSRSSIQDCTTIFALSMMLSSVQCYNLMQNLREDNLQHLELFTEYGRLALQQSNQMPFQKLLFILRDWPYAFETDYGWQQHVIDSFLRENEDQTPEMQALRTRIKTSFEQIQAFLMPYPGFTVAQGANYTGEFQQISPDFIKYVKELIPGLLAPENLIIKKINGNKVRARDLVQYLESYTNIFNGGTIPEPKTVLRATAEASYQILYTDCINHYIDTMRKSVNEAETYLTDDQLMEVHNNVKKETLAKFSTKPKLGGDEMASTFENNIKSSTEEKLQNFKADNERKRQDFIQKANLHNDKIIAEIYEVIKNKVQSEAGNPGADLNNVFNIAKQQALDEFNSKKVGGDGLSDPFRDRLQQNVNEIHSAVVTVSDAFNRCLQYYSDTLHRLLQGPYKNPNELVHLYHSTKNEAKAQYEGNTNHLTQNFAGLTFAFHNRIENEINGRLPAFERLNADKPHGFVVRAEVVAFRWPVATVTCPPGTLMLSGGGNCKSMDGRGWTFLYRSQPISENQFQVGCDTPEKQNLMAEAYVVCE